MPLFPRSLICSDLALTPYMIGRNGAHSRSAFLRHLYRCLEVHLQHAERGREGSEVMESLISLCIEMAHTKSLLLLRLTCSLIEL